MLPVTEAALSIDADAAVDTGLDVLALSEMELSTVAEALSAVLVREMPAAVTDDTDTEGTALDSVYGIGTT